MANETEDQNTEAPENPQEPDSSNSEIPKEEFDRAISWMGGNPPRPWEVKKEEPVFAPSPAEKLAADKEAANTEWRISNLTLMVLDLSLSEDVIKYEKTLTEIIPKVHQPGSGWILEESPRQIITDPTAPRGFRLIAVLRFWRRYAVKKLNELDNPIPDPDKPVAQAKETESKA